MFFVVLVHLMSSSLNAGEAFFRPEVREDVSISEGDSFDGVIEIWNIENISPEMISKLVGQTFLEYFYVVKLEKPTWSENNPEVVVIPGTFILEKKIEHYTREWKHGGLSIDVQIKELDTKALVKKDKKLVVLEGVYNFKESIWKQYLPYLITVFVLALLAIIYAVRRKKKGLVVKVEPKINWKSLIAKASSRQEFTKIYLNKSKWIEEFSGSESDFKEFLKCSELYLFKKSTEDFEIDELKTVSELLVKGMRE